MLLMLFYLHLLKAQENIFISTLDDPFDVAHADALKIMTIVEDKEFLIGQKKGRRGSMAGVDTKLAAREKRVAERHDKAVARRQRMNESYETSNETVVLVSSTSTLDNGNYRTEAAPGGSEEKVHTETPARRKRGRNLVATP